MKSEFNNPIDAIHAIRRECMALGFDTKDLSDDEIIEALEKADVALVSVPRNNIPRNPADAKADPATN